MSESAHPPEGTSASSAKAAFAGELRLMRERAGSPSFRELARRAHFSVSTLAEATAGRRLPSEQVVRAFAAACGEDPDSWAARLAAVHHTPADDTPPPPGDVPGTPPARRRGRPLVLGSAVLATACVYGAGFMTARASAPAPVVPRAEIAAYTPTYPASDGTDPALGGCAPDAILVDKAPVEEAGKEVAALELKYSPRCRAGWARLYLYPAGVAAGMNLMLASVAVTAGDGTSSGFTARLQRQQPIYTDVITPHDGCLGATATITGRTTTALSAKIPCEAAAPQPGT